MFLPWLRVRGRAPTGSTIRRCLCWRTKQQRGAFLRLSALFHKYDNVLFAVFVLSLLCSFWEGTNFPRKSPYKIVLTKQEREELERRANKYTLPYFIVTRAKMMLLAEQGLSNDEIANSLSTRREIVSRWRKRFFEKRLGGLEDFPRPCAYRKLRPCLFKPSPRPCHNVKRTVSPCDDILTCLWRIAISLIIPEDFPSCYDSAKRNLDRSFHPLQRPRPVAPRESSV
jgi:hypothetical protein